MTSKEEMKQSIQSVIQTMMDRVMYNVLIKDPFLPEEHRAKKPLYAFLVPDEIFKGSHFERRFTTPFGGAWEKLALVAGNTGKGKAVTQYSVVGTVNAERLRRIQEVLNRLEHRTRNDAGPDWASELEYVLEGESEKLIPTTVLADLYLETHDGEKLAFELKAPLPNSDQTKVSKEKMLKLYAMEPKMVTDAYYALPYNPYGKLRSDYTWLFPARWFNMQEDPVVLIGNEFWDKIGGAGTYDAFLEAVNEMGAEYKDRIYREYLGVEPHED